MGARLAFRVAAVCALAPLAPAATPGDAAAADAPLPALRNLRVSTAKPFAGDTPLLATVTPNGDGLRDSATISFRLTRPARVSMLALAAEPGRTRSIWSWSARLPSGRHGVDWRPRPATLPRTYALKVTVETGSQTVVYGSARRTSKVLPGPVVRVRGVDAVFDALGYVPGQVATVRVATDARRVRLRVLWAGAERAWSSVGKPISSPRLVTLRHRHRPGEIRLRIGPWRSGLYFLRLQATDGRVGYAPFVVRPAALGGARAAVILPTNTWQAYNLWDVEGDGVADTWYVDARRGMVDTTRPYFGGGKPPYYRTNDRGFLRFLVHTGRAADYLTDEDLERIGSGDELARLYDVVVFAGHHEYQTALSYDIAERYRDLGGNLMFLSANNFYWRVDRKRSQIWRIRRWRELGRPEARLVGVQYRANESGAHAAQYAVVDVDAAPWLFRGLGLVDGAGLGYARYGIEYDMVTADSPPGTVVLAKVDPKLRDPSIQGQMTYYETPAGAKVFAAGTLSFGGSDNPVGAVLFANLWAHLSVP